MNEQATISELSDYPVVTTLPIQWGDQDAFGHVNNTVPIRWFESSRIAYLAQTGLSMLQPQNGIGPILAAIRCDYRRQLSFPDTVHIGARVTQLGRTSMTVAHRVYSQAQQATAAEGDSVIVVFDYDRQRPVRIPDEVRAAIEKLEGRPMPASPSKRGR
jgi:acyl-CoA thioester hydrolase